MPSHFLFAIEWSDEPAFDPMLADLAAAVLAYAGLEQGAVTELNGELRQAIAGGTARERRRCRVRFQVAPGTLTLSVAGDGMAEWQTTRSLP